MGELEIAETYDVFRAGRNGEHDGGEATRQ